MPAIGMAYGLSGPLTGLALGVCFDKAQSLPGQSSRSTRWKCYFVSLLGGFSLLLMTMYNCSSVITPRRIGPAGTASQKVSHVTLPSIIASTQLLVQISFLSLLYLRAQGKIFTIIVGSLSMLSFGTAIGFTFVSAKRQYQPPIKPPGGGALLIPPEEPMEQTFRAIWLFSGLIVNGFVAGLNCLYRLKFNRAGSSDHQRHHWGINVILFGLETSLVNFIFSLLVALMSTHLSVKNRDTAVHGLYYFFSFIQLPSNFLTIIFTLPRAAASSTDVIFVNPSNQSVFSMESDAFGSVGSGSIKESEKKVKDVKVYTTTQQTIWD